MPALYYYRAVGRSKNLGVPRKVNKRHWKEKKKGFAPMAVKIWGQALEKTPKSRAPYRASTPEPPVPTALNIMCLDLKIMSLQKQIIHPKKVSRRQLSTLLQ